MKKNSTLEYSLLKIRESINRPIQTYKRELRFMRLEEMYRGKGKLEKLEAIIKIILA